MTHRGFCFSVCAKNGKIQASEKLYRGLAQFVNRRERQRGTPLYKASSTNEVLESD